MEGNIGELVAKLTEAERQRDVDGLTGGLEGLELENTRGFVPWKGRNMERLVMKLDYLTGATAEREYMDKLVDDLDDE